MRIFKNKEFNKWARKQNIKDASLLEAVQEIKNGLYDAYLGGGIYKKRMACGSKGKRGGMRVILALQMHKRVVFMYGFQKLG